MSDLFNPTSDEGFTDCDRCGKELEHNRRNTQAVWCNICKGKYCLDCWFLQRREEDRK
jgi:hypothetical protein